MPVKVTCALNRAASPTESPGDSGLMNAPWWYLMFSGALLGACTGSFVAVILERVPDGRSLQARSRCLCGRKLGPVELLPIAGYLLARGQARCCGVKIPRWYLHAELFGAGLGAVTLATPVPVPARWGLATLAWVVWAIWGLRRANPNTP